MSRWYEPTPEQVEGYRKWVEGRPVSVRRVIEQYGLAPWNLYRLADTGQRVYLLSLSTHDDGTVSLTVAVSGKFNLLFSERSVFGIKPEDLTECELPPPDELVGVVGPKGEDRDRDRDDSAL
jgi:hypothetical protein